MSQRLATPDDNAYLRKLYCDLRRPEFTPLGLDTEALDGLVNQQFDLRAAHYERAFPSAETSVFVLDDEPIGYWIVDYASPIRLVDFLIDEGHRGQGIGSMMLARLLSKSKEIGQEIVLNVEEYNPARRLYQRNGFNDIGTIGVYVTMSRPPG